MRLPHLTLRRAVPPDAFGLDISDDSVKALQLHSHKGTYTLDFAAIGELPSGLIKDGEIINAAGLATSIKELLHPYQDTMVGAAVLSLPEIKTTTQTILVPKHEGAVFSSSLIAALPEFIPNNLEEVYFDAMILSEDDNQWKALVGVSPRAVVDSYVAVMEAVGITPAALDVEPAATVNAVISPALSTGCHAIVNLGRRRSHLIVVDDGKLLFTLNLPIAGELVSQELMNQLSITFAQAEKTKRLCGLDPKKCEGALRRVLEAMVQNLIVRITEGGKYYRDHFADSKAFSSVVLTGGGAELVGLTDVLAAALAIPVTLSDVWANTPLSVRPSLEGEQRFSTVIGLARRGERL
ncbi:MAG: pilus assembly protein PilM [Patescibacteria group bacterium]|jgi:type IV pilus assembly protein PilM